MVHSFSLLQLGVHVRRQLFKKGVCTCKLNKCGNRPPTFPFWQYGQRQFLSTDLQRFLEEVGTDPKEARFWLRQFQQQATDLEIPLAILQIKSCTLQNTYMMERLCCSVSFLHRNGMPTLLVYGPDPHSFSNHPGNTARRKELVQTEMNLVDSVEKFHGKIRAFCGSNGIIYSKTDDPASGIDNVNPEPIKWALRSGHIPLLLSLSIDHSTGTVTPLCSEHVAIKLCEILKPMKMIFLNESGGLVDDLGNVISDIKIPADIPAIYEKHWCEPDMEKQIDSISNLFNVVPDISSVVITSPDKILKELFTHQGSGTIFQKIEAIHSYKSLKDVNVPRLAKLLMQSFKKPLIQDYMEVIEKQLCSVYISGSYSAAAIVIQDKENCEVPYLDKFVISSTSQGQGTSEALWDHLTKDFRSLFWRSRATNRINPWYFVRADGSWTNGDWIVFWYGIDEPTLSHSLVEHAANLPDSFDPVAKHDETQNNRNQSTTSYIQYI